MDVAETSLALAASFTTVPCALLLTDVALSMTFEASRVQHTGKALLETWRELPCARKTFAAKYLGNCQIRVFSMLGLNEISMSTFSEDFNVDNGGEFPPDGPFVSYSLFIKYLIQRQGSREILHLHNIFTPSQDICV